MEEHVMLILNWKDGKEIKVRIFDINIIIQAG